MEEILDLKGPVAQWVQSWGYFAVFFGIMLENAGIPVPGETIIIIASVLAGQGILKLHYVYITVVLGAIIGDNIGYWIGQNGGRPLLMRLGKLWRLSEEKILETERNFLRHSDWAVFFGRFVTLLRIFAGPMAGMIRMPWPRFFIFNAAGALVWAAVVVGLSYLFGEHIATLLHNLGLTLLGAVVLLAAWLGFKYWRRKRQAPPLQPTAGSDEDPS
jgi:membrane protein DedA with SNARE-associated domain